MNDNSLVKLVDYVQDRPVGKCQFVVYAYCINADTLNSDGSLDPLRAILIPLGAFSSYEKAEAQITRLQSETGYGYFFLSRYGRIVQITTKPTAKIIAESARDSKAVVDKLQAASDREAMMIYERRLAQARAEEERLIKIQAGDTLQAYTQQCYQSLKLLRQIKEVESKLRELQEEYKEVRTPLVKLDQTHPEFRQAWLPELKIMLEEKEGHSLLYGGISHDFQTLQTELFSE